MRTVILLSGMMIADAIKESQHSSTALTFMGIVLVAAIVMDVVDFFRGEK